MLKMNDVRAMDEKSIKAKIKDLRLDLHNYKLEKNTATLNQPHLMKQTKRDIARLQTVLNEKK